MSFKRRLLFHTVPYDAVRSMNVIAVLSIFWKPFWESWSMLECNDLYTSLWCVETSLKHTESRGSKRSFSLLQQCDDFRSFKVAEQNFSLILQLILIPLKAGNVTYNWHNSVLARRDFSTAFHIKKTLYNLPQVVLIRNFSNFRVSSSLVLKVFLM